jgi:hypothetical protein
MRVAAESIAGRAITNVRFIMEPTVRGAFNVLIHGEQESVMPAATTSGTLTVTTTLADHAAPPVTSRVTP